MITRTFTPATWEEFIKSLPRPAWAESFRIESTPRDEGYPDFHSMMKAENPVPDGFDLIPSDAAITPGDLIEDADGEWRGPVPHSFDLIGRAASSLPWAARLCRRFYDHDQGN